MLLYYNRFLYKTKNVLYYEIHIFMKYLDCRKLIVQYSSKTRYNSRVFTFKRNQRKANFWVMKSIPFIS